MQRFGRRHFLRFQLSSLSAFLLASCRRDGWLGAQDPVSRVDKTGSMGLPSPSVDQEFLVNTAIKDTARQDYQRNFAAHGGRLSNHPSTLQPYYDVLVIGSGYGASISAARLAPHLNAGKSLCVIERGREWVPGEFPDNFSEYMNQVTAQNPLGVYDFRIGREVDVIQGSGLGGTSLINANTAALPDAEVFLTPSWPQSLRNINALMPYYQRAARTLGANPTPLDSTGKARTMKRLAEQFPASSKNFSMTNATVTLASDQPVVNEAGIRQRPCTFCGDCISGCNVGAKNTLPYNYLPLAKKAGAQIFSELSIVDIEEVNGEFLLSYIPTSQTKRNWWEVLAGNRNLPTGKIRAKVVILGAGSLGSTGILLRSQAKLPTSPMVGQRFSSNGDVFAIYKDLPVQQLRDVPNIRGKGAYDPTPGPGPTIQTMTKINPTGPLEQRLVLEDLCVPRAFVPSYEIATMSSAERGMFLLGMGHDGADGRIVLDRFGQPLVSWPGVKSKPLYSMFKQAFATVGSIFSAKIPWWKGLLMRLRSETAHPLGGCVMADSPARGVVNDRNQVFRPDGSVYPNLYVIDGAAVPSSLGINPFMTISAIAERAADLMITERRHPDIFS